MTVLYPFIAALTIMTVSLIGVLATWKPLGFWLEKNLSYLVSFSAGVFLVISYNLAGETFAVINHPLMAIISILAGFILFNLFDTLIPESHHHHESNEHGEPHSRRGARKMLIGDSLHNISDGIILVPAFLAGPWIGLLTTLGILIHESIQGISEFFVLRLAGYSIKQSLLRNFGVNASIFIGVIGGLTLTQAETLIGPFLGIAAGGFFYVVLIDLVPTLITNSVKEKDKGFHLKLISAFLIGLTLITSLNLITAWAGLGQS